MSGRTANEAKGLAIPIILLATCSSCGTNVQAVTSHQAGQLPVPFPTTSPPTMEEGGRCQTGASSSQPSHHFSPPFPSLCAARPFLKPPGSQILILFLLSSSLAGLIKLPHSSCRKSQRSAYLLCGQLTSQEPPFCLKPQLLSWYLPALPLP